MNRWHLSIGLGLCFCLGCNHKTGNEPSAAAKEGRAVPVLDKEYEILLDALGFEPASLESLADVTGLSGESLASMLLILELEGRIAPHPGGRYCRVP